MNWYMFHEILHWYTLGQPWGKKWTPTLARLHATLARDPRMVEVPALDAFSSPGWNRAIFPDGDPYPPLPFNLYNVLGHVHLNALRRYAFRNEPRLWEEVKAKEKGVAGLGRAGKP